MVAEIQGPEDDFNFGLKKTKRNNSVRLVIVIVILAVIAVLSFQLSRIIEKKYYRLDYLTLIRRYSKQYELDPYLVASIIHCESSNKADAVSSAGAIGLMQIMPDTGEWIAQKLKTADYNDDLLKSPEVNIEFGCWYLDFLFERFDSDDTVFAAYNAGHNRVKKWLEDKNYSGDGQVLDDIPYPQTKDYVEKIQRTYEKYKTLYPDVFT